MASVQITAWDVAQAMGLRCIRSGRGDDFECKYVFNFNGKVFTIEDGDVYDGTYVYGEDSANACAAEKLFKAIANVIEI